LTYDGMTLTGAVLAPPLWGSGKWAGLQREAGHGKNFARHMFKYAVFDLKPH